MDKLRSKTITVLILWTLLSLVPTVSADLLVSPEGNVGIGTSTPKTKLEVNGGIAYTFYKHPDLNSGESINHNGYSFVLIKGNGGSHTTNSTVAVSNGLVPGHHLIIVCTSSHGVTIKDEANTKLSGDAVLSDQDSISLIWNGARWIELSRSNN